MEKNQDIAQGSATPFAPTYFHGTKADLKLGSLIVPGNQSNYDDDSVATHVYCTGTLDAAIWGAELAKGEGKQRIYLVEPLRPLENDPDLTDKKFKGNPTLAFRTTVGLRIIGEVQTWLSHPQEKIDSMKQAIHQLLNK